MEKEKSTSLLESNLVSEENPKLVNMLNRAEKYLQIYSKDINRIFNEKSRISEFFEEFKSYLISDLGFHTEREEMTEFEIKCRHAIIRYNTLDSYLESGRNSCLKKPTELTLSNPNSIIYFGRIKK